MVKISIGHRPYPRAESGVTGEWNRFLKKRQRDERSYFFFTIRMVSYALCSIFLTLFFVTKLVKTITFSDKVLVLFYLSATLFVLVLIFIDVNRFNKEKFLWQSYISFEFFYKKGNTPTKPWNLKDLNNSNNHS